MNRPLAAGSNSCDDGGDSVTNAALSGNPLSIFVEIINFAQFGSGAESIPDCGLAIAALGSRLGRSSATNALSPLLPTITVVHAQLRFSRLTVLYGVAISGYIDWDARPSPGRGHSCVG
jgi:hypothetical protein